MAVAKISEPIIIQRGKAVIRGSEVRIRGENHGGSYGAYQSVPLQESEKEFTVNSHKKVAEGEAQNLGLILVDPKRRRKDEGIIVLGSEGGPSMGLTDMNVDVQINLEKAGPGVQARLGP